jgi:NAD(P)-dependent dehydrogenase (short-subunit alcohol dehydrogenase family)
MLLQMKGLSGTIIGYVHRRTGEFLTPPAMERLLKATISRAAPVNSTSAGVAPVTRVRWRPVPIKPPATEPGRLAGSNVLVVGGSDELAAAVVRRLQLLGATATRFADDTEVSADAHGVIDLSACGPLPEGEERPWEPLLDRSVRVLKALWEPWSRETKADRIFYMPVTALGGLMGYDGNAIAVPYGGIWAGLAKSLPREIANCNVKVLDVADATPDAVANLIAEELGAWDLFEVGYRAGQRHGLLAVNEAPGAPQLSVGMDDTILISGGGRGIGFGVAEALARRTGCRVIVTGRSALPEAHEPWLSMGDEDFRAFSMDRLKAGAAARNVAQVKAQLDTLAQTRSLSRNLERMRASGLRIDYAVCDFNNRTQVQALVQSLGSALTGVIHNAGIDTPVRLAAKSPESFIATVRVKVAGFLNLLQALADAELKFFCNVGSIAGRLGGMAGQTDYAAGNDGLARLGFWAQSQVKFPVKTICWPTWHNLGLIANFDVAVKYMSAVDVEEGVTLWIDEILQGGSAEIGYPGRPGRAVSPLELKGFRLVTPEFPNFDALYSRSIYLGTMLEHRRARSMRTRSSIDPRVTPMLQEFLVGARPAIPVSLLLEYAAGLAADEIVPENWPAMQLREVRNCSFETAGLALASSDAPFVFEREVTGRWHAKRWLVDVTFTDASVRRPFGRVQFVFERDDQPAPQPVSHANVTAIEPVTIENARGLTWCSLVLDSGHWARTSAGELVGKVRRRPSTDVWALPYVPRTRLPGHLVEAALRAIVWETANAGAVVRIGFERLRLVSDGLPSRIVGKPHEASFAFVDDSNAITHTFEKITVQSRSSQNRKVATA